MTMGIDRASSAARGDDTPASGTGDNGSSAEWAAQTQAGTSDTSSQPRAETRTREEYADAMRAGGSPMSRDNSRDTGDTTEGEPPGHVGRQAGQAEDHGRAEPRDRETYARDIRAGHGAGAHRETAATATGLPAETALDPAPASNGRRADQAPDGHAALWRQDAGAAILTDAGRTGASQRPREDEPASVAASPVDGQPGGLMVSAGQAAMPAQEQRGAYYQPETITFDGKDIEITHNAADGIWVEGLPGEVPRRIGDLLSSPEERGQSRIENFREEFDKDAEDILDMGGKWTDLLRDTLGPPPPTNSMTRTHTPEMAVTTPEHGINAGHGIEAFLTLAIVGAAAVHNLHERWRRAWDH
jgi:hypothetical protein